MRRCRGSSSSGGELANEPDCSIQEKINFEMRMREGICKLLAVSTQKDQLLHAVKNLMVCNARILAYKTELQRQSDSAVNRTTERSSDFAAKERTPCRGKIAISDLRIPLMWKDSDHFSNKDRTQRYSVFCLLRIGSQVFDTDLLLVDKAITDICFENVTIFEKAGPDFQLKVEVYSCCCTEESSTITNTPKKLVKKFKTSIGKATGKKLSSALDDGNLESLLSADTVVLGAKYGLLAHTSLGLESVEDSFKTHSITIVGNEESSFWLPLYGSMCCRLVAQPFCMVKDMISGFLNQQSLWPASSEDRSQSSATETGKTLGIKILRTQPNNPEKPLQPPDPGRESLQEYRNRSWISETLDTDPNDVQMVRNLIIWKRLYCVLRGGKLLCYYTPEEIEAKVEPALTVSINKETRIRAVDKDSQKKNSNFSIINPEAGEAVTHIFAVESREDLYKWMEAFWQHFYDFSQWKQCCEEFMKIEMMSPRKPPLFLTKEATAVYQDISIDSPVKHEALIDTVQRKCGKTQGVSLAGQGQECTPPSWAAMFDGSHQMLVQKNTSPGTNVEIINLNEGKAKKRRAPLPPSDKPVRPSAVQRLSDQGSKENIWNCSLLTSQNCSSDSRVSSILHFKQPIAAPCKLTSCQKGTVADSEELPSSASKGIYCEKPIPAPRQKSVKRDS